MNGNLRICQACNKPHFWDVTTKKSCARPLQLHFMEEAPCPVAVESKLRIDRSLRHIFS